MFTRMEPLMITALSHSSERQAEYRREMARQARVDGLLVFLFYVAVAAGLLAVVTP